MFNLLLGSILSEFDQYSVIYTFATFQQQFQPQKSYAQVLMSRLYVFQSVQYH
jgi:hypothetical protein